MSNKPTCMLSCFGHIWLCAALWTITCQAPLSMGFSRQDYLSGLPCLPPGNLPNPGIEPEFLTSPVLADRFFTISVTWETSTSQQVIPVPQLLDHVLRCGCLVAKSCPTLFQPRVLQPARLLCPWDFLGRDTGVGCHFLLQGICPTQGSNPCLLHWQVDSLPLSHQGRRSLNNYFYYPVAPIVFLCLPPFGL